MHEPRSMPLSRAFVEAIADDAEGLAALHDRELTPTLLNALLEAKFPESLGLLPHTEAQRQAWQACREALRRLEVASDARRFEELAADYAAIYLTGAYGVSPCESFWRDEDHLHCQEAMFAWRAHHARLGLRAVDWRKRPDDHLVLQLLHIARALRQANESEDLRRLAQILDEHTLAWIFDFAAKVAYRCREDFYRALAMLTAAWLDGLREVLAQAVAAPRPLRAAVSSREAERKAAEAQKGLRALPGGAPTW
ncbi:MAG: molecular chaperone TorD family protein [Rhodocyclaceae bacterium]|nr:molecular chaperone TorD family protein [Rhodocyclaceae bacterium]